jgi:DNA-binding FadR family transcriptional regulator
MGTWEVRGALTTLEADGDIVIDQRTGAWFLADDSAKTQPRRDTA